MVFTSTQGEKCSRRESWGEKVRWCLKRWENDDDISKKKNLLGCFSSSENSWNSRVSPCWWTVSFLLRYMAESIISVRRVSRTKSFQPASKKLVESRTKLQKHFSQVKQKRQIWKSCCFSPEFTINMRFHKTQRVSKEYTNLDTSPTDHYCADSVWGIYACRL